MPPRPPHVRIARPVDVARCAFALACALACALASVPSRALAQPNAPAARGIAVTDHACAELPTDEDRDTLDDGCELALARAFAPALVVDARDCLWSSGDAMPRLGGGYLFAAAPVEGGVRIAYLPAYFRDCGWSGAPCLVREARCGAHDGDSELIIVDVAPAGDDRWGTVGVFLSAHCFGRSDGRCRWYRGDALTAFGWVDGVAHGAPRVWIARGKHGGYPTKAECDGGHWAFDSCDGNAESFRFPVVSRAQNIGSRLHPLPAPDGCLTSVALVLSAPAAAAGTRECPWDESRAFRGWQSGRTGPGPSAYGRYLARFAAF